MKTHQSNIYTHVVIVSALFLLCTLNFAHAQETDSRRFEDGTKEKATPSMMQKNGGVIGLGIVGTVTSISGTSLTVNSRSFNSHNASTTYTVNALGAVVLKNNATSTLENLSIGDRVSIRGRTTATTTVAKFIYAYTSKEHSQNTENAQESPVEKKSFFASIKDFFRNIFSSKK